MTTCLGKSCSFGLLGLSFENVYHILCLSFFPFWYCWWDVMVLIPDHCLSINMDENKYFNGSIKGFRLPPT